MPDKILQPGDIIFSKSNNIFSRLIRTRTMSQWSHCGIVIGRKAGTIKCVSARLRGGVKVDSLKDWASTVQVLRLENVTELQKDKMIDFCLRQVGKKYDVCGILDFLTFQNLQSNSRWFCSELVNSAMLYAGIDLFKSRKESAFISPGDLYENPMLNFVVEI